MKTLIVYFSHTGNNQLLVNVLQEKLIADTEPIEELRKRTSLRMFLDIWFQRHPPIHPILIPWSAYDHVILMAPIWNGRIANPMLTFIEQEKENLPSYSFVTLCGGSLDQSAVIHRNLVKETGKPPVTMEVFRINDLLPDEQKGDPRYLVGYQVEPAEVSVFAKQMEAFVHRLEETLTSMHSPVSD